MTAPPISEEDLELEELRRRRREEILTRRAPAPQPSQPPTPPKELRGESIAPFLEAHPRVVVDVWAPWCGPCRTMAPVLETLAQRLHPKVRFAKVNADEEPGWATQWGVSGIPTLLLFERSHLVDRLVGAQPLGALEARLRAVFRLQAAEPANEESG